MIEGTPLTPVWDKIGVKNHHGICVPLASIRTSASHGIGEFGDLCHLIDFCEKTGLDTIQILPINDSGPDPSPYNALSAMALHPIYLSTHALPGWEKKWSEEYKGLNDTQHVDYTKVLALKEKHLRLYYEKQFTLLEPSDEFQTFLGTNAWVMMYALFKALKKKYDGKSWLDWPPEHRHIGEFTFDETTKELEDEIYFHIFCQFLCFMQLRATKKYASEKGVMLMGDIPILISPDSADVWMHPDYFDLGFAAGAPPDVFNEEGQYWGFPVYNWEAMEKRDYNWWQDRLKYAEYFYDLYRIDHVLGLFHLWSIPRGKKPIEGKYMPEGAEGVAHGRRLLERLVESTRMMPIAEDVGIIPEAVFQTLHELGIPGTRCIRWQRRWETDKHYFPYKEYHPINMTTVSTHDSETLEQWWELRPEEARLFCKFKGWEYKTPLSHDRRLEILRDSHHTPTYFHINLLQEYLALEPDFLWGKPEEERINVPGFVLPTNWTYRFKPSVEEMSASETFCKEMEKILR